MEENKEFGYTAREWMMAFLEMTDGNASWYEIQERTGLSDEDSKTLARMFASATKNGWPNEG